MLENDFQAELTSPKKVDTDRIAVAFFQLAFLLLWSFVLLKASALNPFQLAEEIFRGAIDGSARRDMQILILVFIPFLISTIANFIKKPLAWILTVQFLFLPLAFSLLIIFTEGMPHDVMAAVIVVSNLVYAIPIFVCNRKSYLEANGIFSRTKKLLFNLIAFAIPLLIFIWAYSAR